MYQKERKLNPVLLIVLAAALLAVGAVMKMTVSILFAALLIWLSATQLNVKTETAVVTRGDNSTAAFAPGDEVSILSWNIGYAGLGEESDFFMDGGGGSVAESPEVVREDILGSAEALRALSPDFVLFQEVDIDGTRSHHIDEYELLRTQFPSDWSVFCQNYDSAFLAWPLYAPHGANRAGLATFSRLPVSDPVRKSLPISDSFSKFLDLDRCYSIVRVPAGDAELVLFNVHLSAYGADASIMAAQREKLYEDMTAERAAGNYVIAGGDFNQTFPGGLDKYPIKNDDLWTPGMLDDSMLPDGWHFAYDTSVPTCRLDNQPYDAESEATQHYVIDGFILSPNVELTSVQTQDDGFRFSDHNPVLLEVTLLQ